MCKARAAALAAAAALLPGDPRAGAPLGWWCLWSRGRRVSWQRGAQRGPEVRCKASWPKEACERGGCTRSGNDAGRRNHGQGAAMRSAGLGSCCRRCQLGDHPGRRRNDDAICRLRARVSVQAARPARMHVRICLQASPMHAGGPVPAPICSAPGPIAVGADARGRFCTCTCLRARPDAALCHIC